MALGKVPVPFPIPTPLPQGRGGEDFLLILSLWSVSLEFGEHTGRVFDHLLQVSRRQEAGLRRRGGEAGLSWERPALWRLLGIFLGYVSVQKRQLADFKQKGHQRQ